MVWSSIQKPVPMPVPWQVDASTRTIDGLAPAIAAVKSGLGGGGAVVLVGPAVVGGGIGIDEGPAGEVAPGEEVPGVGERPIVLD